MKVAAVLAAGGSRRMGSLGSKLDLELGGSSVLERSVTAYLRAALDSVLVVVADGATHRLPEDPRLRILFNRESRGGMASSLRVALDSLPDGTTLVAVGLGDMPLLRTDTVDRLIGVHSRHPSRIVYPVHEGKRGHPVLWPDEYVPQLRSVSGDRGARLVLDRLSDRTLPVTVDDEGVCLDIDSPDDYARAKSRFGA